MPEIQTYMPKNQRGRSPDAATVSAMASESGHSARLSKDKQQLFLGSFHALSFPSGMRLHAMDATELVSAQSTLMLHPCLSLGVLLEGRLCFHLGGQKHELSAKRGAPLFFLMNTLAPSVWMRELHAGQHVKKIVLSVAADWLAEREELSRNLQTLLVQHNVVQACSANAALIEQAESLLSNTPESENFQLEVAAFQLFARACQFLQERFALEEEGATSCEQHLTRARGKVPADPKNLAMQVRHFLENRVIPKAGIIELDLGVLARDLGSSSSTLQRKFKQAFAITIHEYTRERKMQLAKEALIKHNTSIGEAAYLAGYKHYPNFVSAFKAMFGQSPGAWKKAQILQAKP